MNMSLSTEFRFVFSRLNEWENQINVVNKVNHSDVGWTLGWTVLATNNFPSVTLTSNNDDIGNAFGTGFMIFMGVAFIFGILLHV